MGRLYGRAEPLAAEAGDVFSFLCVYSIIVSLVAFCSMAKASTG